MPHCVLKYNKEKVSEWLSQSWRGEVAALAYITICAWNNDLIDKLWLFRLEYLANIFSNMWEQSEPVTSRKITHSIYCQWHNLSFQAKIGILENMYPQLWAWQLPNTQRLTGWDECSEQSMWFCWWYIRLCINIWMICITQWANFPNA